MKTPESQLLNSRQQQRHEPTKKDILHPTIKKEPQIDGRRGCLYLIIKSHTCQVGDPQIEKELYCRGFPIGVSSEPHMRLPSLLFLTLDKEPQSTCL